MSEVLYLPFDENTGSIAYDASGNNNSGSISGSTWVTGKYGNALNFDGNDDVMVPWASSLDFGVGNFTVALWVKGGDQGGGEHIIIRKDHESGNPRRFWSFVASGELALFEIFDSGTSKNSGYFSIGDNNWHHIVGVRDGDLIKVYYDGVFLQQTDGCASLVATNTSGHVALGRYEDYAAGYYDGVFDEVRIYNRALSADEIKTLYQFSPYYIARGKGTVKWG